MSALIVLGTRNRKKGLELADLLAPRGFEIKTLADFPGAIDVAETGDTFRKNAELKAVEQARHLRQWVLADDSGLAVEALRGAPGVYSARYAGEKATDDDNNRKLLAELENVPLEKRSAHYTAHVTLADPEGNVRAESEAYCRGRITRTPSGGAGFGYDPYFEIVEYHRTFAELGNVVKTVLSHRARAMEQILPQLTELLHSGQWGAS